MRHKGEVGGNVTKVPAHHYLLAGDPNVFLRSTAYCFAQSL